MRKEIQELSKNAKRYSNLESRRRITWCDGCGNYGIQNALKRAVANEGLGVRDVMFFFDIGCGGNGSDKIEGYTAHGLHGRIISFAAGAAIANTDMQIITHAGDGATLSEGVNHLVHAIRNNFNMLFVLHNNEIYGLTTGQASATTRVGCAAKGTTGPISVNPINAMQLALSLNPSFVARAYSGDVDHMTDVFRQGMQHTGFAMVEVFQACPTYSKVSSSDWYRDRVIDVSTVEDYDDSDIWQARRAVEQINENIHVGVLYRNSKVEPFIATQTHREKIDSALINEVKHYPIGALYQS